MTKLTHSLRPLLTCVLAALVLIPTTAHARDDDRNRGHQHNHTRYYSHHGHGQSYYKPNHWNSNNHRYTYTRIDLSPREESRVRRDLQRHYFDRCGGVNWRNARGCQPTGYRYGYNIGDRLPPHAVVWSVPQSVYYNLPAPRYGTRYAWVDRDLLLISEDRGTVLNIMLRL